ncbi:MAG: hypothetical protein IPK32_21265 [Verrucomicrobiaceae bacterium]|nr:hypothetical protein [Verrucomicrobiaceae bacterium]
MKTVAVTIAIITAFLGDVFATSFAPPKDRLVKSENEHFVLRVHAKNGKHEVFAAKNPKRVLWSFTRPIWHDEYFVSDDGSRVVWIAWEFVKTDELQNNAVEIWSKDGIAKKASFKEVGDIHRPSSEQVAPIGDFWRIWRDDCTCKNGIITLLQRRKNSVRVDLNHTTITKG